MLGRLAKRATVFAAAHGLLLLAGAQAAEATLLNCMRQPGRVQAYVDGFADSLKTPLSFDVVRALIRLGEDEYEFDAEHVKQAIVGGDGVIRIHAIQNLSAGATAEFRFEGTPAPKGATFIASLWVRAENREERGTVRCTID
jgi:hypothetical protein